MAAPSFISSATGSGGNSWSISYPASRADGDLLLMFAFTYTEGSTINTPSGWTLVGSQAVDSVSRPLYVFTQTSSGSGGSVSLTASSAAVCVGAILCIRNSAGVGTPDWAFTTSSVTSLQPDRVTTPEDNCMVVYAGVNVDSANFTNSWLNATERTDSDNPSFTEIRMTTATNDQAIAGLSQSGVSFAKTGSAADFTWGSVTIAVKGNTVPEFKTGSDTATATDSASLTGIGQDAADTATATDTTTARTIGVEDDPAASDSIVLMDQDGIPLYQAVESASATESTTVVVSTPVADDTGTISESVSLFTGVLTGRVGRVAIQRRMFRVESEH